MLDLKYLETHTKEAIARLSQRKHFDAETVIQQILTLNKARKQAQHAADTLAETLNKKSKAIGRHLTNQEEKDANRLKEEVLRWQEKHKALLQTLKAYEDNLQALHLTIPNLPDPQTPQGESPSDNTVIHQWGDTDQYAEAIEPHWTLLEQYKLASLPLGTKITGAGFPVYQGKGAKLQRALITFFLEEALQHGYEEVLPPLLINAASSQGTGQLPDKEGMMYVLQQPPLYLIPTAEVPVTNLYRETILDLSILPIKHVAYTPCFRREAGSWGADVRGLNRLHQFDKVELVEIHYPSQSQAALERMRRYGQRLLEKLGLPYRTLLLCSGDLGHTASITYDLEVWSGAQKKWLEVSSISSFKDYQARRMNLRYREQGRKNFCHTLNGSALALPRVMAAILENYQTKTRIPIPEILHPYTGFSYIEKP